MPEKLTAEAIRANLHTRIFGAELTVLAETPSTNTVARQMAEDGAPAGTAVVAGTQSGGRGRRGRAFFSPDGGVYLSVILRPGTGAEEKSPDAGFDPGRITSGAAVAAARAIERFCPLPVGIKWVNDLWLGGKKIAGILAESAVDGRGERFVILGIGVNVAKTDFPPELHSIATSLGNEGVAVSRAALIAAVLEEWERQFTAPMPDLWDECRRRSVVLGRQVTVMRGNEQFPATAVGITDEGHLLVEHDGVTEELYSGEVSLKIN